MTTARAPRTFAVGDRVVTLPGTSWDNDAPSDGVYQFAGHYGHVVAACDDGCAGCVHVVLEGTIDGRGDTAYWNRTRFDWPKPWHMFPDEIEHAD